MTITADRVHETTTTTGTGSITLAGAVSQFETFQANFSVGQSNIMYCIVNQSANEYEVGLGTLTASTTLSRDVVETSSNSNALVNFSAGTKDVWANISAADMLRGNPGRHLYFSRGYALFPLFPPIT